MAGLYLWKRGKVWKVNRKMKVPEHTCLLCDSVSVSLVSLKGRVREEHQLHSPQMGEEAEMNINLK